MIIGISGKALSGKDTSANMLKRLYMYPDTTYKFYANNLKDMKVYAPVIIVHFADMLKETAKVMCNLDDWDVNDQDGKRQTIKWLGITVRELLQKLGTCIRQGIDNEFWIKSLYAENEYVENIIIADVRFPEEVKSIKDRGGIVLRLVRDGAGAGNHISETALDDYTDWDYVIENNGTLEDLFEKLREFSKKFKLDY